MGSSGRAKAASRENLQNPLAKHVSEERIARQMTACWNLGCRRMRHSTCVRFYAPKKRRH